jgi:tetratricopeptide (TPR) repeat protein
MTPAQVLEVARSGDLERLAGHRGEVVEAVRTFAGEEDAAAALELVGRAWQIWFMQGELEHGAAAAEEALETPGGEDVPVWRARVLYADGVYAFRQGDNERSRRRNEEALQIARNTGDARGECDALTGLARLALRKGRYDDVVALAREGRAHAQASQDREAEAGPLHLEAAGFNLKEHYTVARDLYLESLTLNTELGNDGWVAMEQHNLGWVALRLDDVDEAEIRFRERDERTHPDAYGDAWSNLNWAAVAAARGNRAEAERRFAAGTETIQELGAALDPDDEASLAWLTVKLATM